MAAIKLQKSAADFLPAERTLETLREAARSCKGCDLYKNATQTASAKDRKERTLCLSESNPEIRKIGKAVPSSDLRDVCLTKP